VGLSTEKVAYREIKLRGDKSLVFGVEMCEYVYNKKENGFTFKTSRKLTLRKKRVGKERK
jgi:hypothetical protein